MGSLFACAAMDKFEIELRKGRLGTNATVGFRLEGPFNLAGSWWDSDRCWRVVVCDDGVLVWLGTEHEDDWYVIPFFNPDRIVVPAANPTLEFCDAFNILATALSQLLIETLILWHTGFPLEETAGHAKDWTGNTVRN